MAKNGWKLSKVTITVGTRSLLAKNGRRKWMLANQIRPTTLSAAIVFRYIRFWPKKHRELPFLAIAHYYSSPPSDYFCPLPSIAHYYFWPLPIIIIRFWPLPIIWPLPIVIIISRVARFPERMYRRDIFPVVSVCVFKENSERI